MGEVYRLRIEQGALTQALAWEDDWRGRNWAATLEEDPEAAEGIARRFWRRGRGKFLYLVPEDLAPGQVLEFGADLFVGPGHRVRRRAYGVVVEVSPEALLVRAVADPEEGFAEARRMTGPGEAETIRQRIARLEEELARLRQRLAELEGDIPEAFRRALGD